MLSLPLLPYCEDGLAAQVHEALQLAAGCIVSGMPCPDGDAPLEALSLELGEPLYEPHNLRGGMVCRVEVEPGELRPYANTPFYFPGHTDCADHAEPSDTVLLLCQQPAVSGGESFVAPLDEILKHLSLSDLLALQAPRFYFRYGYLPVLSASKGLHRIRYNRLMFEMFQPPEQLAELNPLLDRLDQAIQAVAFHFRLTAGDCLILDNQRSVHGRTAFEPAAESARLMKRVRLSSRI
ncbi:MAG: hypothetical protein CVV27_11910 [Candidatus Melainabacteria bacterium HGW-Melainabacteria-1]|nr:MAG: hypothetical protein CVV27_11910 [Candidatus Melainabacteria bacterium HGW-Melainabacteria-1]